MITVVDYGAGNLYSVTNALDLFETPYRLARVPADLRDATSILLPGVGHFGQMMRSLSESGLRMALRVKLVMGTPYMGICLGMQALYESSEEDPHVSGICMLPGTVRRFPIGEKIPHMGWTKVNGRSYYFAHSYYVPADAEGSSATARHGLDFTAVVRRGNLYGTQFHPEKSGAAGLALLKEWVTSCQQNASLPAST